jgi:phage gp36-like protein
MSWAAPADLMARKDYNILADLCQDEGERPSRADMLTNVNIQTSLDDASADIEAALFVAHRYSLEDLTGLTGNSLALLKRMTCDLAMAYLYDRRPIHNPEQYERYLTLKRNTLERLRTGENVFNLPAQEDKALPTIDGPTNATYERLNLIPERTPNFYPFRSSRLPTDRG